MPASDYNHPVTVYNRGTGEWHHAYTNHKVITTLLQVYICDSQDYALWPFDCVAEGHQ